MSQSLAGEYKEGQNGKTWCRAAGRAQCWGLVGWWVAGGGGGGGGAGEDR